MKKPTLYSGPIDDAERARALERLIEREVQAMRYEIFRNQEAEYYYERGMR